MLHKNLKKPFQEFKWKWASVTPSEGLNEPRVYLGVLRVLRENEGKAANSEEIFTGLQAVEDDLEMYLPVRPSLARDKERNLLRNSQQYWSSLGLLEKTNPVIALTSFGQKVADGIITNDEFAETVVSTLQLPNSNTETVEIQKKWSSAGVKCHPLLLILSILYGLSKLDLKFAYITNEELTKVVIPLSSINATINDYIEQLLEFRKNPTSVDSFEDFAPEANDKRMTREFLLFLSLYGFVRIENPSAKNLLQRFTLAEKSLAYIEDFSGLTTTTTIAPEIAEVEPNPDKVSKKERSRKLVSVTHRPEQPKFRKDVLASSGGECLITKENLKEVLRACHIVAVENMGSDEVGNGLCLREDLHILFDSGHLRIDVDGVIHLSELANSSNSYKHLSGIKVAIPAYVDKNCLAHRWKYF